MFIGQNQFCSSDLLAKIADVIDSAILITRLGNSGHYDQRIIYMNQSFSNLTGYGSNELLGRSIDIICDPRTGASKMLEFYSNCRSGQNFSLVLDSFRRQGSEIKLKVDVRPIIDNVQGAYYYILMCRQEGQAAQTAYPYQQQSHPQQQSQQVQQQQMQPQAQYGFNNQPQFAAQVNSSANSFANTLVHAFAQPQQQQAQPQQPVQQQQSYAQNFGGQNGAGLNGFVQSPVQPQQQAYANFAAQQQMQASYGNYAQQSVVPQSYNNTQYSAQYAAPRTEVRPEVRQEVRAERAIWPEPNSAGANARHEGLPATGSQWAAQSAAPAISGAAINGSASAGYAAINGATPINGAAAQYVGSATVAAGGFSNKAVSAAAQFSAMQDPQPGSSAIHAESPKQHPDDDFGIPVAPIVTNGILNGKAPAEIKTDEKIAEYCKTQFLSNMSHDLRTPLNAIIGFSEVIKDQLFGPIENNRYVAYAGDIHKSGQELLGTITEIMELSEIEPEAERIEEDKVDLSDIVESVLDVLSPKAFESDVKIIKSLDAEDVKFKGDRRKLKQVVAGVINNAIKYSKKGSKIELSTSITDRGDYRLVVYAPTAHFASSKSSLGSLLGTVTKKLENDNPEIALARKFVEAHEGKFSVFHSATSGTELNITLPSARISIEPEKKTWLKVIS